MTDEVILAEILLLLTKYRNEKGLTQTMYVRKRRDKVEIGFKMPSPKNDDRGNK